MRRVCQEIRIPLQTGSIAGKWWGPQDKRPIVALHGWQDNCGSFDRLIPLLPPHVPILALDFPGHGHSYRYPPGIPYHSIHGIIFMQLLQKYFGWKKMSLMAHSLGACLSYTYACSYPDRLDFLICFDALQPIAHPLKMQRVARSVEQFVKYDAINNRMGEPPSYTLDEMATRVHLGSMKSVEKKNAKYLLARNIVPSGKHPGKFHFKSEARLKVGPLEIPDSAELIRCGFNVTRPVFVYKANGGSFYGDEENFVNVCKSIKASSEDFQFRGIAGTHHVHLNQPEVVAGILNDFLARHYVEDGSCGGLKSEMKL